MHPFTHLLTPLSVLHLRVRVRAREPIHFSDQPGSALRGAFYSVLSHDFCSEAQGYGGPDHARYCPVCWLLALEDAQAGRGKDLPRPLVIEPPLEDTYFAPDEEFTFGLALIGQAQWLLPFVVRAVERMGQAGLGRQRGRFTLCELREYDPLLDVERSLLEGRTLRTPKLIVNSPLIEAAAENLRPDQVTLHFLSPMRLTDAGRLVKTPEPVVLIKRLVERCQSLVENYGVAGGEWQVASGGVRAESSYEWRDTYAQLSQVAEQVTLAESNIHWVEVQSGSRRQGRMTPISGFVGSARWQGPVAPLLPWLLWGQSVHVGKDAVKGNGWFKVGF